MRRLSGSIISAGILFGVTLLFCLYFAGSGQVSAQSDDEEPSPTVTAPAAKAPRGVTAASLATVTATVTAEITPTAAATVEITATRAASAKAYSFSDGRSHWSDNAHSRQCYGQVTVTEEAATEVPTEAAMRL